MATPRGRGLVPLTLLSAVVVLVALGLSRGVWVSNLHNGLLAVSFAGVGVYLRRERPRQRLGILFLATGLVEGVMFFGRQVGHAPSGGAGEQWWGWMGVWPLAIGIGLTTLCVLFFPDGRLPSSKFGPLVVILGTVLAGCAMLSAGWPVEYADVGVSTTHPLDLPGSRFADAVWSALAHPAYAVSQLLWPVVVVVRWRTSGPRVRRQLAALGGAVTLAGLALVVGLVLWDSPTPGVLTVALVPVAAGWAVVHGQNLAAYAALTWLSRIRGPEADLPGELAQTVAEALDADKASVWMGDEGSLLAIGTWPRDDEAVTVVTAAQLCARGLDLRPVLQDGVFVGALTVRRSPASPLSLSESRLLDDLCCQAALVIERRSLVELVRQEQCAGQLEHLTPRERQVLELMARGLSNAAICAELHLSVKTVEPIVSSIFTKLGLHAGSMTNRRVLAVVEFLRARDS